MKPLVKLDRSIAINWYKYSMLDINAILLQKPQDMMVKIIFLIKKCCIDPILMFIACKQTKPKTVDRKEEIICI